MRISEPCRRISAALVALLFLGTLLVPPGAPGSESLVVRGRVNGTVAVFRMPQIKPLTVRRAALRAARGYRRLGLAAVRRGVRREELSVRLEKAELGRVTPRLILRTRDHPEFDGFSATGGSLARENSLAYSGPSSIRAFNDGEKSLSFARVWDDVNWGRGTEVSYGAAFFIPAEAADRYAHLLRWDNYLTYGKRGDVGGIELSRGKLTLFRSNYDGSNYTRLVSRVAFPRDRWFLLEVRQRLSQAPWTAHSEVFLDRHRVGSSVLANSRGRRIDDLRAGYVYVEGPPSTIFFDRLSIRDGLRPIGG
jgi:hypothetical protein